MSILYKSSIKEAIPLDIAKGLLKNWDKTRLADWFVEENGKHRVYLPLVKKVSDEEKVYSGVQLTIKDLLDKEGYEIKDYQTGVVVNKKYNREEKLGRILQKLDKELLSLFNLDKTRQGSNSTNKDPIVAISRNPYDIYGMSTDRQAWDSCKNMGTKKIYGKIENKIGQNSRYMEYEILHVLIAYLISPMDKNIENPIARVLMLPYLNDKKEVGFVVASDVYPLNNVGAIENVFVKTVKNWLDSKQGKLIGKYTIDPFVYNYESRKTINFKDTPEGDDLDASDVWKEKLSNIDDDNMIEAIIEYFEENNIEPSEIGNVTNHYAVTVMVGIREYLFYTQRQYDDMREEEARSYADNEVYEQKREVTGKYSNIQDISYWLDYNEVHGYLEDNEEEMDKAYDTMGRIPCSHCNGTGKDSEGNPDLFGGTADCLVCSGLGYTMMDRDKFQAVFEDKLSDMNDDQLFTSLITTLGWTKETFKSTDLFDDDKMWDSAYENALDGDYFGEGYEEIGNTGIYVENN